MRAPRTPEGTQRTRMKVLGSSGRGVSCLLCGVSESLWRGSCSCSLHQLNRPKVNKIVEILEKAKSCYWPALQNVYMDVMDGKPGKRPEPSAGGPGPLPTRGVLRGRSWVLRELVFMHTGPPGPISDRWTCASPGPRSVQA